MPTYLIALVTLIYVYVSGTFFFAGNLGMGMVWFGYAFANVGLILAGGQP